MHGYSDGFVIGWNLKLDRFILNRPAMDFNYAHYMLTEARKGEENPAVCSKTNLQRQWRLSK